MAISFAKNAVVATVAIVILILAKGSGVRCGNGHFFLSKKAVVSDVAMAILVLAKTVVSDVAIVISIWQKAVVAAAAMAILVLAEDEWLGCAGAWIGLGWCYRLQGLRWLQVGTFKNKTACSGLMSSKLGAGCVRVVLFVVRRLGNLYVLCAFFSLRWLKLGSLGEDR